VSVIEQEETILII